MKMAAREFRECFGGVDDGFFDKSWLYTSAVLAVHCFENSILCPQSVYTSRFTVDGLDATDVIVALVRRALEDKTSLRMVLLDTPIFAGFNIAEPWRVYEETNVPVVIIVWHQPSRDAVERALKLHFKDWVQRLSILDNVWRDLKRIKCPRGELFIAVYGISYADAWREVCRLQVYTRQPEPLYTAHTVASTISRRKREEWLRAR